MSLKRVSYIVFVVILVGLSALGGAVVGGWAVYRAIGTQSPPPPTTSLGVIRSKPRKSPMWFRELP